MAVAPVTNWLFYDSIYTERYMSLPATNIAGYETSSVLNVTAFSNVDFFLAHGSGDDNVHYMNSASLVDKLTQKHVRGWRFRMFTDRCVQPGPGVECHYEVGGQADGAVITTWPCGMLTASCTR